METGVSTLKQLVQQLLDQTDKPALKSDVSSLARAAFITVLALREQHKKRCLATDSLREQTNTSKTQLDQSSMQLQNLLYEKQHYDKEIQNCRNFTSEVTDEQVNLAPVEEFEAAAPEDIKATLDGSEHKLMLARLQFEKQQRLKLTSDLEQLQQEKQQALQTLQQKKSKLDDLKARLVAIGEQSKQLQPLIAPPVGLKTLPSTAASLPTPLYIIFSQFAAAQEALQLPISITVNTLQDKPQHGLYVDRSLDRSSDAPETQGAKRRRSASTGPEQPDMLKVHKSEVQITFVQDPEQTTSSTIPSSSTSTSTSIAFVYYTSAKLVGIYSSNKSLQALLAQVEPSDKGSFSNYEQVQHLVPEATASKYAAKPYRWAQELAGLDFLASLPEERPSVLEGLKGYRQQQRAELFVSNMVALMAEQQDKAGGGKK